MAIFGSRMIKGSAAAAGSGTLHVIPAGDYLGAVLCCDRIRLFASDQMVYEDTTRGQISVAHSFGDAGVRLAAQGSAVSPGDEYEWRTDAYEMSATVERVSVEPGAYVEVASNDLILSGEKPLILSGLALTRYVLAPDGSLRYTSEAFMTTPRGTGRSAVIHKTCTGKLKRKRP